MSKALYKPYFHRLMRRSKYNGNDSCYRSCGHGSCSSWCVDQINLSVDKLACHFRELARLNLREVNRQVFAFFVSGTFQFGQKGLDVTVGARPREENSNSRMTNSELGEGGP